MSDYAPALANAREMRTILLDHGVPEVDINLKPGRPSSHGVWNSGFFVSEFSHHTVSRYSPTNLTPILGICRNGRGNLGGPLCNGYGGWDLCYRIITFGLANHPGQGGPVRVPALNAGTFLIPKDSARRYAWGTEYEGGLSEKDWDRVLVNPRTKKKMTFREFMGRSNAALEVALEIHRDAHLEHSSWTSRKIDRLGYTRAEGIAEKAKYKKVQPEANLPIVDYSNVRAQFRIALGLDKGKIVMLPGIKRMQSALNARYGSGLKVDGIVGIRTIQEWEKHERKIGVEGYAKVPSLAPLNNLGRGRFRVYP